MDAATALSEIVATLKDFMQHRVPIVAYNGVYDFTVLAAELARRNMAELAVAGIVDPFVLDKQADTYRKGKRTLAVVSEHYEVVLDNAHTSQADFDCRSSGLPSHRDVDSQTISMYLWNNYLPSRSSGKPTRLPV